MPVPDGDDALEQLRQQLVLRRARARASAPACSRTRPRPVWFAIVVIARGSLPNTEPSTRKPPFANDRVRARHLERVHRLDAEADPEVALQRARDPHLASPSADDARRPDDLRQLREHGVVGDADRLCEVDRPEVLALVVVDVPVPVAEEDRDRLRDERRQRRDPLLQRGREHERLEGRARLPLALRREVELALRGSCCRRTSRARLPSSGRWRRARPAGLSRSAATCGSPARASLCSWKLIVVSTRKPLPKTRFAPNRLMSCCFTYSPKYGASPCTPERWTSCGFGIGARTACRNCAGPMIFCASISRSTVVRRAFAACGWATGS